MGQCIGTANAALAVGGRTPTYVGTTEEFSITEGASVYFNRDTCVRCVTGTCTQIS